MNRVKFTLVAVLDDTQGLHGPHLHGVIAGACGSDGSGVHQQMQGIFQYPFLLSNVTLRTLFAP
jgi:hypothetical protein